MLCRHLVISFHDVAGGDTQLDIVSYPAIECAGVHTATKWGKRGDGKASLSAAPHISLTNPQPQTMYRMDVVVGWQSDCQCQLPVPRRNTGNARHETPDLN